MRSGLLAVGLLLLAAPAHAEEMPRYDVARHCDEIASVTGAPSEVIRKGCFRQEQSAYDGMKRYWPQVPVSTRDHCDEIARVSGAGSYVILKGCLEMERKAATDMPSFKY
jgi:hypothetical protein